MLDCCLLYCVDRDALHGVFWGFFVHSCLLLKLCFLFHSVEGSECEFERECSTHGIGGISFVKRGVSIDVFVTEKSSPLHVDSGVCACTTFEILHGD